MLIDARDVPEQQNRPQVELWLYDHATNFRMPVDAFGLFSTVQAACEVGQPLQAFLRDRRTWPRAFDLLDHDGWEEVRQLPDFLSRVCGVDPAGVLVTARPYPVPGGDQTPVVWDDEQHVDTDVVDGPGESYEVLAADESRG